jgi:signal transduction histidine kinase
MKSSNRYIDGLLLALIVGLTLSTGYIHYWVGGIMLTLNALGYATLALAVVVSAVFFHRFLPLVLMALAAYAVVTIVGWLIMGPYFDVAYLAKAIEIALITTIVITLRRMSDETRTAIVWALAMPAAVIGRRNGPAANEPAVAAGSSASDE